MNFRSILYISVVLIGSSFCQNSIDLDDGLKQLGDQIPEIKNFNQSSVNVDDIEKAFKEKCAKQGAPDAVELLKAEQDRARMCTEKYVNVTKVQEELEEAQKTGSMDEVFAKYCGRWPQIYACFDNATSYMRQCMDKKEEESFNKTLDIIKELKEFMCFKDGDRLAMFVAEGGIDCMKKQEEGVKQCLNETVGSRIPSTDDFSPSSLPSFIFSASDCTDFDNLRECFNKELEKCEDSTPANIVDAFFKFLKKQMPCQALAKSLSAPLSAPRPDGASGSWNIVANAALILSMVVLRV